jgi:glyoxylase-like metal-dependent hydrolase (beta-lactamase superfamily II)
MELKQVSKNCYAVLNEKNRVCDANSGFINLGGGIVIDTQSDLAHAEEMIRLFSTVWTGMPKRVVLTHEDGDHVWGNQLFKGAEIIAHRSVPEQMKKVAEPKESQELLHGAGHFLKKHILKLIHPGIASAGKQLLEDYDFDGLELVFPTTLFDDNYTIDLDGKEVQLIYVGPCHQVGDVIVHVPSEGVIFAGDIIFKNCTPMGWTGSYDKFFKALDLITQLNPKVIVPGHGPLCGLEGVKEMRDYLQYVRNESKKHFDNGLSALEAAKKIDFGPSAEWKAPARLYMNVERAYREFRNSAPDAPWDKPATFDAIYKLAKAKGVKQEF